MTLSEVTSKEELKQYYEFHALVTNEEKVNHLAQEMQVTMVKTEQLALNALEEYAIHGVWKVHMR